MEDNPKRQTKAGYLVTRLKTGEGLVIGADIEIRIVSTQSADTNIAVKAPKHLQIRKVR